MGLAWEWWDEKEKREIERLEEERREKGKGKGKGEGKERLKEEVGETETTIAGIQDRTDLLPSSDHALKDDIVTQMDTQEDDKQNTLIEIQDSDDETTQESMLTIVFILYGIPLLPTLTFLLFS